MLSAPIETRRLSATVGTERPRQHLLQPAAPLRRTRVGGTATAGAGLRAHQMGGSGLIAELIPRRTPKEE
jgi:hypothetical protein